LEARRIARDQASVLEADAADSEGCGSPSGLGMLGVVEILRACIAAVLRDPK
jgi:hypothetical protein